MAGCKQSTLGLNKEFGIENSSKIYLKKIKVHNNYKCDYKNNQDENSGTSASVNNILLAEKCKFISM